jgi:phenylpyruvate tautomerase PptA (4-oxalocrotonate tautomerase family)
LVKAGGMMNEKQLIELVTEVVYRHLKNQKIVATSNCSL